MYSIVDSNLAVLLSLKNIKVNKFPAITVLWLQVRNGWCCLPLRFGLHQTGRKSKIIFIAYHINQKFLPARRGRSLAPRKNCSDNLFSFSIHLISLLSGFLCWAGLGSPSSGRQTLSYYLSAQEMNQIHYSTFYTRQPAVARANHLDPWIMDISFYTSLLTPHKISGL